MELSERIKILSELKVHRATLAWKPYMVASHCDTICEVGVRTGVNFKKMIDHQPKLAVAVDCWIADGVVGRNDGSLEQAELDNQYETFKQEMADKPFVKICRGYSLDVVKEFPDNYFDFVYIDADHTYKGISQDILAWYPKVKSGGFFGGHDYKRRFARTKDGWIKFGIIQAVDDFVEANKLQLIHLSTTIWGVIKP
jgi:hypothetical protein